MVFNPALHCPRLMDVERSCIGSEFPGKPRKDRELKEVQGDVRKLRKSLGKI